MSEIVTLIVTKAFVVFYMIVLPLMVLDLAWWQFLIGFMAMHMTAGLILGVIFQLAHVVEGTEYLGPDDDGNMEHAWLIHEMRTTSNFAHSNKLLQAYIGGLNYQIEHHLFPQVCSIHYPEIGKIVREVAARYDIPYHYHPDAESSHSVAFAHAQRVGSTRSRMNRISFQFETGFSVTHPDRLFLR